MTCASCGKETPAGARYCLHCGAAQSVPTPIAAVAAAAMASRMSKAVPQAANASQADPASGAPRVKREPLPWPGTGPDTRVAAHGAAHGNDPRTGGETDGDGARTGVARGGAAAGESASAAPAYAAAPRRTGLAALTIAACLAVGIAAAYVGWRTLDGNAGSDRETAKGGGDESIMSSFPPEATPRNARRPAASVPSSQTSPVAPSPPAGEAQVASAPPASSPRAAREAVEAPPAGASAAVAPPVEIKPLPAKPSPRAARRSPAEKAPAAAPAPPAVAPAPEPPPRAPVIAAAPKAAPVVDRWMRMNEELSRCTREDFIMRVICDQRVRLRYCDGYWGKAAQCPGNPGRDHGQ